MTDQAIVRQDQPLSRASAPHSGEESWRPPPLLVITGVTAVSLGLWAALFALAHNVIALIW
jgi:hypothetical protein